MHWTETRDELNELFAGINSPVWTSERQWKYFCHVGFIQVNDRSALIMTVYSCEVWRIAAKVGLFYFIFFYPLFEDWSFLWNETCSCSTGNSKQKWLGLDTKILSFKNVCWNAFYWMWYLGCFEYNMDRTQNNSEMIYTECRVLDA